MKRRLDIFIFEKGLVKSRTEATALILNQKVLVNNKIADKAGMQISGDEIIEIQKDDNTFVSRGGFKLLKAITEFKIDLQNKICLDIGASTGGFTDCMLQHGAQKVYAVDVGYGQLDWKLRNDARVINLEKINFRYWDGKEIFDNSDKIDFVSIDVSFISLKKILPNLNNLIKDTTFNVVALIKPQFEVGREKIGKNGVVRNEEYRQEVILDIKNFALSLKFEILDLCESPIKGPAGNTEYLLFLKNSPSSEGVPEGRGSSSLRLKDCLKDCPKDCPKD
jgi:23S rRNA (cytidine1920-2'-O)/16S rRNA (cytidine1409-2'-O)-methyltransferase